jgi:hypothetical protein
LGTEPGTDPQAASEVLSSAGLENDAEAALATAMPVDDQARLYYALADAYSKREQAKTCGYNYADYMKAITAAEVAVELWRGLKQADRDEVMMAEALCNVVVSVAMSLNTAYVIRHTPYVINRTPYVIHHTPYVIHHTPYVIHHTPYVIHHATLQCFVTVFR